MCLQAQCPDFNRPENFTADFVAHCACKHILAVPELLRRAKVKPTVRVAAVVAG